MSEQSMERRLVDGAWRWVVREEGAAVAGGAVVQQAKVALTAADVLALHDSPSQLIEQEPGTFVHIQKIYGQTRGTTPYVIADSIQIIDGGALSPVNLSGLSTILQFGGGLLSIDNSDRDTATGLTGAFVEYANELSPRLEAHTSNPTGGDLTLDLTVLYTVIELA